MCQEYKAGNSLSLWGRGEGLATKPKILLFPSLSGRRGKDGGEFSFLVTQLGPHPNPLPKGEGVYLQNLGTLWDRINSPPHPLAATNDDERHIVYECASRREILDGAE